MYKHYEKWYQLLYSVFHCTCFSHVLFICWFNFRTWVSGPFKKIYQGTKPAMHSVSGPFDRRAHLEIRYLKRKGNFLGSWKLLQFILEDKAVPRIFPFTLLLMYLKWNNLCKIIACVTDSMDIGSEILSKNL